MKSIKKISLIIIGIALSLILLEISLQTISYTYKFIKNYQINKQLKNRNTITILCLGESTTDNAWPPILQEILDKKSINKKLNVIDGGKAGCDTNDIINVLLETLSKGSKIDIVISMMGINDHDNNVIFMRKIKFKTLKLFYLIEKHLVSNLFADNIEQNVSLLEQAKVLSSLKEFEKSTLLLKNIEDAKINNIQKREKYELLARNSLSLNNHHIDANNYLQIKQYLNIINDIEPVFDLSLRIMIYEKNLEQIRILFSDKMIIDKYFDPIMCSLNDLSKIGADDVVEQIRVTIENSINDDSNIDSRVRKIGYVAVNYFAEGKYTEANKFFNLQTKIALDNIPRQTIKNYFGLYKICKNNNIKLIAMQYPVRSIKPLKEMLKDVDEITFISNEENFKKTLQTHKLEEIFTDRFAGDFGHCTELGNTLIAENVAETILKLYN